MIFFFRVKENQCHQIQFHLLLTRYNNNQGIIKMFLTQYNFIENSFKNIIYENPS